MAGGEHAAEILARELEPRSFLTEVDRPVEEGTFQRRCPCDLVGHFLHDLLVETRYAGEEGGPDLGDEVAYVIDRAVGLRQLFIHADVADHPFEDVAQGEELQDKVFTADGNAVRRVKHVLHQIVVGEHDPLWFAGGARGVDDGHEIAGLDAGGAVPERGFVVAAVAALEEIVENVHAFVGGALDLDQVLERAALLLDGEELGHLLGVFGDHDLGAGVLDLIGDLFGCERAVDGHIDGAE